jgi:hypothetical protein
MIGRSSARSQRSVTTCRQLWHRDLPAGHGHSENVACQCTHASIPTCRSSTDSCVAPRDVGRELHHSFNSADFEICEFRSRTSRAFWSCDRSTTHVAHAACLFRNRVWRSSEHRATTRGRTCAVVTSNRRPVAQRTHSGGRASLRYDACSAKASRHAKTTGDPENCDARHEAQQFSQSSRSQ